MRTFGTQGPVDPNRNYIVNRSEKIKDFIHRVKEGRYIVIFAPRQTGKTTFFQRALDILSQEEKNDFPIQLNFEVYEDCTASVFYNGLYEDILEAIENTFWIVAKPISCIPKMLASIANMVYNNLQTFR